MRLLWRLAGTLQAEPKAQWVKKAAGISSSTCSFSKTEAELMSSKPEALAFQAREEAARCWSAAGSSFRLLGDAAEALACARQAALLAECTDAQILFFELSCGQVKATKGPCLNI